MSKDRTKNITRLIYLFVIVVVILSLLGAPQAIISIVNSLFVSLIAGAVTSFIAATILEMFTGDALDKILIPIKIGDVEFSVSLFVIATVILKLLIFR